MPVDFDEVRESYRDQVDEAVGFSGKDLDFFSSVKADCLRRIVRTEFGPDDGVRVLDVGCGHGFIHGHLRGSGFEVVGVEVATEVLKLARDANPAVAYAGYDGASLPFGAETFDVAFAACVIHHVPPSAWNGFLGEMKRVLRPGGMAVIFEHNPYNPLTRYVVRNNELDRDAVLLSSVRLKHLIERCGFKTVQVRFILFSPFAHAFFRWLDARLGWCPLGAQYYAVAKR